MDSVHHIWCPLSSQEYQDLPDGAETTLTVKEGDGSLLLTHPENLTIPMVCEFSPLGGLDVMKPGILSVQQVSTTQTRVLFKPETYGDYGAVCALARFVDLTIPWTALLATSAPGTIEFQLNGIVGIH